jgi:UDP-N-acetylmuramoylalanine--D-glutamate ligase
VYDALDASSSAFIHGAPALGKNRHRWKRIPARDGDLRASSTASHWLYNASIMDDLRGKRVTIAGLGRFGGNIAAARWLAHRGARVLVTDQAPAEKLAESVNQLAGLPIEFHLGGHRDEDFTAVDVVVASPAIPLSSPYLQKARAANIPVTTEIRLFIERCPAPIIGVTGTKGKSTTTALLGRMLATQFTTHVGGNIGGSLLDTLGRVTADDRVVLELSSFMLEHLRSAEWSPHVAVVTMIAADHLDWHGSREGYVDAKRNIVRFQRPTDYAVLNEENEEAKSLAAQTLAHVRFFGLTGREPFDLLIPGGHNQLNAQAAYAAAAVLGVSREQAQRAASGFKGLPHRLQLVHEENGIRYYNDSIATIPDAAVAALDSFPQKTVIQIVGGYDKKLPLEAMCNALVERAKAVLCIGQTGKRIADLMAQSTSQRNAAVYDCGDLAAAMTVAKQIATTGDNVLLSTGSASYDQFDNFEQRGDLFAKLARQPIMEARTEARG